MCVISFDAPIEPSRSKQENERSEPKDELTSLDTLEQCWTKAPVVAIVVVVVAIMLAELGLDKIAQLIHSVLCATKSHLEPHIDPFAVAAAARRSPGSVARESRI